MSPWLEWLGLMAVSAAVPVLILLVVGGYYHIRYYTRRRHEPETWKCQPKRFLSPAKQREAAIRSSLNLAMGGCISGTLIFFMRRGLTLPIYYRVSDYGWAWTILGTAVLFVLVDGIAYYVHRAFHFRPLYKRYHRYHHKFTAPSPWVVIAVHPYELLALQAATFVPFFIIPFHYVSIIVVFIYILIFNIIDHSGVQLESSLPWQGPTRFHDDHHVYFHVNFGQHLTLWDRLHGTLRRTGRKYGVEVFGGKGAAAAKDAAPGEFIRY